MQGDSFLCFFLRSSRCFPRIFRCFGFMRGYRQNPGTSPRRCPTRQASAAVLYIRPGHCGCSRSHPGRFLLRAYSASSRVGPNMVSSSRSSGVPVTVFSTCTFLGRRIRFTAIPRISAQAMFDITTSPRFGIVKTSCRPPMPVKMRQSDACCVVSIKEH